MLHIVLAFACIVHVSGPVAAQKKPTLAQQVHPSEICWEPDIEFPVPCDEDDD